MKKITLEEFFENKRAMAIHCDTEQKANYLLKEFDKYNRWFDYINCQKNKIYQFYGNNLCLCNDGAYDSLDFCQNSGIEVYEFEEVDFDINNIKNKVLNEIEMDILKNIIDLCKNGRPIYNLTITRVKPLLKCDCIYIFKLKFINKTYLYQMSNYPNMENMFEKMIIGKEYTLDKLFPIEYIKVMEESK